MMDALRCKVDQSLVEDKVGIEQFKYRVMLSVGTGA